MSKLKPRIDLNLYKIDPSMMGDRKCHSSCKPIPHKRLEREFNEFSRLDWNNPRHREALLELFPEYLIYDCHETDWRLFDSMGRYDERHSTFVAGCFDNQPLDFRLISYKWRFKDGVKWKTRAGTSPNSTPLLRIFTDRQTLYVIEGHRDSLTAVLLGLDFIMIPYAGFRLKDSAALREEVAGRNLVFIVEDEAAHECMKKVAEELKETARSIRFIQLDDTDGKVDLSDYVQRFNTIQEVLDGLRNRG